MKNLIFQIIAVNKASKKLLVCVYATAFALAFTSQAQIVNGSFENGFTGWNINSGVFIIGASGGPPVGTSGGNSAVIGGGDITGSILSQTFANFAPGLSYLLRYDSLASVPNLPLPQIAAWTVVIVADAQTVFSQNFSQQTIGRPGGSLGFVNRQISFNVPVNTLNITIRFLDITANGGVGIDPAFDSVSVLAVPEPSVVALSVLGGLGWLSLRRRQLAGRRQD
jgi:hypothetical protein